MSRKSALQNVFVPLKVFIQAEAASQFRVRIRPMMRPPKPASPVTKLDSLAFIVFPVCVTVVPYC